ncbi:MAG: phosphopentomutase [Verrucomicrobiales bacterium]
MRAVLIVLDSVGIGGAPDAEDYGDLGADTLGNILKQASTLELPNLNSLGLSRSHQRNPNPADLRPGAHYGWMRAASKGKDTTTGHWEIAGVITSEPFATFKRFPDELLLAIGKDANLRFIGNYPQSGTVILDELGEEHMKTGHPILYTSADSVLQIAAHEKILQPAKLYSVCEIARHHCDPLRIARVIARPFTGDKGTFERSAKRRDFSIPPPDTVLDGLTAAGIPVTGIGKINDIFTGKGITASISTTSNFSGMLAVDKLWDHPQEGLLFVNLIDFDMIYGHRRDPGGYASCLLEFDDWLGTFLPKVQPEDLLIVTADHGNDPTWPGNDHTREQVPVLQLKGREPATCSGAHQAFTHVSHILCNHFSITG